MLQEYKLCAGCKAEKETSAFPKDAKRKDGLHPYCRACVCNKSKAYYAANIEKAREKRRVYCAEHREEQNARTQQWRKENAQQHAETRKRARQRRKEEILSLERARRAANPEIYRQKARRHRERNAEYYRAKSAEHAKNNPEAYAAKSAERRSRQLNATPSWDAAFTKFVMLEARRLSSLRERATGVKWHVDHIVPLKAKLACGLHTWSNFRVIPATENQQKYNRMDG